MIDTSLVIDGVLPDLHADSRPNLTFWTPAELIRFADEALKRLARVCGIFVVRDTSTGIVVGEANYPLPPRHVATLHVSCGGVTLRPGNQAELEARDEYFQTTPGTPDHWYEDLTGNPEIALTPVPATGLRRRSVRPRAGNALTIVYNSWPPELDAAEANHTVQAPAPLKSYLAMAVVAAAYAEESESEMPDIAAHCKGRMEMIEQALAGYYGRGI